MSYTISVKENDKKTKESKEFAWAVQSGTVIGRSLQDALHSLSNEDANEGSDGESDSRPPVRFVAQGPLVKMSKTSINKILQSFRDGVAESNICHHPKKDGAPQALLKGRCDYYNRYGQNWMVAIDKATLKVRPIEFIKRSRDNKTSLWDRDDDRVASTKREIVLNQKIQLLAYGDQC